MEQSSSKKFKFEKPKSEGLEKSGRDSSRKKEKKRSREKFEKVSANKSLTTVNPDDSVSLKKEKAAHLATKEQVKHLKTKVACLNSDMGELENQLAEVEERVAKVKEEGASKIDVMKQYLVKKQMEVENLKVALSCANALKVDSKIGEERKIGHTTSPVKLEPGELVNQKEPKVNTEDAGVQTDDLVEIVEEDCYDDSKVEEVASPVKPEKMSKKGKIRLVEDISVLVEEVMIENTNIMQINANLGNESKDKKYAQKVMLIEYDKLKEEFRELQAKVLRITIENMKLKRENHKARGLPPPVRTGVDND
eukprot:GFUD01042183.1.p1 GENE.GFUD01042183.1~~GFUD01042183.1.p1  ORF type:complete len:308 (+),score=114.25 GFUD01042183.1:102-1025(+)